MKEPFFHYKSFITRSHETYVENREENEESIDDESNNVGKSCKSKGHSAPFSPPAVTIISEIFLSVKGRVKLHEDTINKTCFKCPCIVNES